MLSKEVSSTIFKVFGMMQPGIEPTSPGPLANTLPTGPMSRFTSGNVKEKKKKELRRIYKNMLLFWLNFKDASVLNKNYLSDGVTQEMTVSSIKTKKG